MSTDDERGAQPAALSDFAYAGVVRCVEALLADDIDLFEESFTAALTELLDGDRPSEVVYAAVEYLAALTVGDDAMDGPPSIVAGRVAPRWFVNLGRLDSNAMRLGLLLALEPDDAVNADLRLAVAMTAAAVGARTVAEQLGGDPLSVFRSLLELADELTPAAVGG